MRYRIYEEFYNDIAKKLKRIGKKCAKHGNQFVFEVVGNEMKVVEDEETKKKTYYKFIVIEVEGTAKIDNYELIAVLENHDNGNVIRRINNDIDVPSRFWNTDNICEHCNSRRQRNKLYIIHNVKTGEYKQVGSNCLMLYTGGLNAEYIASYIDGITKLEEFDGFIGGGNKRYVDINEVIGYAVEIINKMGYFNSNSNYPTKYMVREMLERENINKRIKNINKLLWEYKYNIQLDVTDFHKDNTKELVGKIIEYYLSLNNDNEFINNVQVLLKDGYIEPHNIGYLCYLPQGYYKHIEKEIEKAKQNQIKINSNHYGEVGKRYKLEEVHNIKMIANYDTMYGTTCVYRIILKTGNILIWKSTNWFCFDELEKVDKITFTIKSHGEYKGEKQTEVTRCKLNIKE